jgi:hypothetical protein
MVDVGSLKRHAALGEPVNMRRSGMRIAETTDGGLQIIHADQQHIGPVGGDQIRTQQKQWQEEFRGLHFE